MGELTLGLSRYHRPEACIVGRRCSRGRVSLKGKKMKTICKNGDCPEHTQVRTGIRVPQPQGDSPLVLTA